MIERVAPPAGPAAERASKARLREAAAEFEAVFVTRLLEAMRGGLGKGGILPSGAGHAIYQGMLDSELARAVSKGRGLGLADMLVRELSRREEIARQRSAPAAPGRDEGWGAWGAPGAPHVVSLEEAGKRSSPGGTRPIVTDRATRELQGGVR